VWYPSDVLLPSCVNAALFNSSNPYLGTPEQKAQIQARARQKQAELARKAQVNDAQHKRHLDPPNPLVRRNVIASDVADARRVVADSIAQMRTATKPAWKAL
jgi:hypothetical protein